jgi:hypothetical protein
MRDDIYMPWQEQLMYLILFFGVFIVGSLSLKYVLSQHTLAPQDKDYVQAIVGEAANQSEDTMVCIAHALRNRGTLKGVYGYKAAHIWSESDGTWRKAWIAWYLSGLEKNDPVHGAKNFGAYKEWARVNDVMLGFGMGQESVIKAKCGDFYFY